MTCEDEELMTERLRQNGSMSSVDVPIDTRVYREFVSVRFLRGALDFRKYSSESQVIALERLKNRFSSNIFKVLPSKALNNEARSAEMAITEKKKMGMIMGTPVWPLSLNGVLQNLLFTNTLDDELREYAENSAELIPSLADAYKLACPIQGPFRIFMHSSHNANATLASGSNSNATERVGEGEQNSNDDANDIDGASASDVEVSELGDDQKEDAQQTAEVGLRVDGENLKSMEKDQELVG